MGNFANDKLDWTGLGRTDGVLFALMYKSGEE